MASRVSAHRARLRQKGMKPVQLWVADTQNLEARKNLLQICIDIENYPGVQEDEAFVYALAQDDE